VWGVYYVDGGIRIERDGKLVQLEKERDLIVVAI